MFHTPWRPKVAVRPLFRPDIPKPSVATICLATANVLSCCRTKDERHNILIKVNVQSLLKDEWGGTWTDRLDGFLSACNLTLTASNGLMMTASVNPEHSPASVYVWKQMGKCLDNSMYIYIYTSWPAIRKKMYRPRPLVFCFQTGTTSCTARRYRTEN